MAIEWMEHGCAARACTAAWVMLLASGLAPAATGGTRQVDAKAPWIVSETTELRDLEIGPGAVVSAGPGHSLTFTVDGIGLPLAPGKYHGRIVLTPTPRLSIEGNGGTYDFRAAVVVRDGKYVPGQSVPAAVKGGLVGERGAGPLQIDSREEKFNGVLALGDGTYTLDSPRIDMLGNGGNDFAGFGAAIASMGSSRVFVDHAHIHTHGAVRTALWIGGKSTMWVNDSDIEVESGQLPAGYEFSIQPGKMMEVPYGLGIEGNVRATNLMDEATVFYTNSRFRSNGWGVLSSDGGGPTRMFVKDCKIEAVGSGYGAYANGDAHDFFSHTRMDVADAGIIIAGPGWATLTDATEIHSAKTGVFMHQGTGGSLLTVERKSRIISRDTAVQVKGRGADIIIDDSQLEAGNGVLIQSMENDDPILKSMRMVGGIPAGPAGDATGGPPGGAGPPGAAGPPGGGAGPGAGGPSYSPDVTVLVRRANLEGDILHALTASADMSVTLQEATLRGAISTSVTAPASGKEPDRQVFRTVGMVVNTLQPSRTNHGLSITVDAASHWIVTRTSYLGSLTIADGASVQAPAGKRLVLSVDGQTVPLHYGTYKGRIILAIGEGT